MSSVEKRTFTIKESHIVPHGKLLEGISYDERNDTLYYIDIPSGSVFSLVNASSTSKALEVPTSYAVSKSIGVIGLTSDPTKLVCGVEKGISILDLSNGNVKAITSYPNDNTISGKQLRSNDGSVAPDGSFWVGTMDVEGDKDIGTMWLLKDKDTELEALWSGCIIPNGINWDAKRNTMYWTESGQKTIYKYKYDFEHGEVDLASKTPFFVNSHDPDGSCLDSEGNLYVAVWGQNKVVRLTPEGKTDMEWIFPSRNISCCTFGDKNFSTLYVTSADLTDSDEPDSSDMGAAVFRVDLSHFNIKGVAKNHFVL